MSGSRVPPVVGQVVGSPGRPLPAGVRADMEARLGADFSRVRVHTDAVAAQSAVAVRARAYTLGSDVVFGAGQFAPNTGDGQRLLAHELVHVAQHSAGLSSAGAGAGAAGAAGAAEAGSAEVGAADSEFEREADRLAANAMAVRLVAGPAGASAGGPVAAAAGPSTLGRAVLRRQPAAGPGPAAPAVTGCSADQVKAAAVPLGTARQWLRQASQGLSQLVAGPGVVAPAAPAAPAGAPGGRAGAGAGSTAKVSQALKDHFKTDNADTARYVAGVIGKIAAKIDALMASLGAPAAGGQAGRAAGGAAGGAPGGGAGGGAGGGGAALPAVSVECHTEAADISCRTAGASMTGQTKLVICPSFFTGDQTYQVRALVHEIAHSIFPAAGMDITDRGYQSQRIYQDLTRDEALTNADSYALFVVQLGLDQPIRSTAPSDDFHDCPREWKPLVEKAAAQAQFWNRNALSDINDRRPEAITARQAEFDQFLGGHTLALIESASQAYKKVDDAFKSDVDFECEPTGGGRCDKGAETYWYAIWSNFHICPVWQKEHDPDDRTEGVLAGLYGFEGDVGNNDRRRKLAQLARTLTKEEWARPKPADVAAALHPPPPAPAPPQPAAP